MQVNFIKIFILFRKEADVWDKAIDKEMNNLEMLNLKIEMDPFKSTGFAFVSF